jgi:hypothetical protein
LPSLRCQFTAIDLPQYPGTSTSFENRRVDFGDPDHGFFSATVYYSPSSGSEYWFYTTDDGGLNWTHRFGGWGTWIQNYFLTAVNSDTCLIAYGREMGDNLIRISGNGSVSFGYYDSPNWSEVPENVSILNDSIQYYAVKKYDTKKEIFSALYRLEGDTMILLLQANRDTMEILKSHFISQDTGFLITKNASENSYSVIKTSDGCNSFKESFTTTSFSITDIDFFNPSIGMICCSDGLLFKTTDAGQSWYSVSSGTTEKINCLAFVNDQTGYFGGDNGRFYTTADQGESWTAITSPSNYDLLRLKMFSPGNGYLIYDHSFCYRYLDISSASPSSVAQPVLVYPNPATSRIIIEFPPEISGEAEISLANLTGEVLFDAFYNENQVIIDISGFSKGIYILTISYDEQDWQRKLVKY